MMETLSAWVESEKGGLQSSRLFPYLSNICMGCLMATPNANDDFVLTRLFYADNGISFDIDAQALLDII